MFPIFSASQRHQNTAKHPRLKSTYYSLVKYIYCPNRDDALMTRFWDVVSMETGCRALLPEQSLKPADCSIAYAQWCEQWDTSGVDRTCTFLRPVHFVSLGLFPGVRSFLTLPCLLKPLPSFLISCRAV